MTRTVGRGHPRKTKPRLELPFRRRLDRLPKTKQNLRRVHTLVF